MLEGTVRNKLQRRLIKNKPLGIITYRRSNHGSRKVGKRRRVGWSNHIWLIRTVSTHSVSPSIRQ